MSLSVCVPCSSRPERLQALLDSLKAVPIPYSLLIADTTPEDAPPAIQGAYARIIDAYPAKELLRLPGAGPSAARYELGCRVATDYALYLDEDLEVRSGNIERMLSFMHAHPDVGLCSGRWVDHPPTAFWKALVPHARRPRARTPGFLYAVSHPDPAVVLKTPVRIPSNVIQPLRLHDLMASMLLRRPVLEAHGFDPRYSFYMELFDFFFGLFRADVTCVLLPDVIFDHHPGAYRHRSTRDHAGKDLEVATRYFREKWGVTPVLP